MPHVLSMSFFSAKYLDVLSLKSSSLTVYPNHKSICYQQCLYLPCFLCILSYFCPFIHCLCTPLSGSPGVLVFLYLVCLVRIKINLSRLFNILFALLLVPLFFPVIFPSCVKQQRCTTVIYVTKIVGRKNQFIANTQRWCICHCPDYVDLLHNHSPYLHVFDVMMLAF